MRSDFRSRSLSTVVWLLCAVAAVGCGTKTAADGEDAATSGEDTADAAVNADTQAGTDAAPGPDTIGADAADVAADIQQDADAALPDAVSADVAEPDVAGADAAPDTSSPDSGSVDAANAPELGNYALNKIQAFDPTAITTLSATLNQPASVILPKATVDWGDGTTSDVGPIVGGTPISATHQYTTLGKFTVSVSICLGAGVPCKDAIVGDVVVACSQDGFGDCANGIADGCEVDLASDPTHCGSCLKACGGGDGKCALAEKCVASQCAATPAPVGTACRAVVGPCDITETCDGASTDCPGDVYQKGSLCRAATGDCDMPEYCPGDAADCPADAVSGQGVECRGAAGDCDLAEACDGASKDCPADALAAASALCRKAVGTCDKDEYCTGAAADCPKDALVAAGSVCRATAGPCDIPETCDGLAGTCPTDKFDGSGTTLSSGGCGTAGVCDGSSATGGATLSAKGTVCRASKGVCDPDEVCDGVNSACPYESYAYYGKKCREATNGCDIPEYCGYGNADCPAETFVGPYGVPPTNQWQCSPDALCYNGTCGGALIYGPLSSTLCDPNQGGAACQCAGPGVGALAAAAFAPIAVNLYATQIDAQSGQDKSVIVDPSTIPGGILITGSLSIVNSKDRFNVITRDGQVFHGVAFWFDPVAQSYGISGIGNAVVTPVGPASAPLAATLNDVLHFALTDDGTNVSAKFWVGNADPAKVTTVNATCTTKPYRVAGGIHFLNTNDDFQPVQNGEVIDPRVYAIGGAFQPDKFWDFNTPAQAGVVYSSTQDPLTLPAGVTQVATTAPGNSIVKVDEANGGALDLGPLSVNAAGEASIGMWLWVTKEAKDQYLQGVLFPILSTTTVEAMDPKIAVTFDGWYMHLSAPGNGNGQGVYVSDQTWHYVQVSHKKSVFSFGFPPVEYTSVNWTLTVDGVAAGSFIEMANVTNVSGHVVVGVAADMTGLTPTALYIDDVRTFALGIDGAAAPVCAPTPAFSFAP